MLTLGVAGLFLGAMGKSAQFPFHIWLPDAMEGPTPVSALIHAATMVAAGVYLMVRISPLLAHTPEVAFWVMTIGAFTAFLAATMALVARDVKRILAFSTVSQLGYMMAAVGAGASVAGYFHLTTHAFFKALLFLAAGSVIHAVHTNDIFDMGRLWKKMPVTGHLLPRRRAGAGGHLPAGGLLLQGRDPDRPVGRRPSGRLLGPAGHGRADRVLHVPGLLRGLLRRPRVPGPRARVAGGDDRADGRAGRAGRDRRRVALERADRFALMEHSVSTRPTARTTAEHPAWIPFLGTLAAVLGIGIAWLGYQRRAFSSRRDPQRVPAAGTLLERRYFIDDIFEWALPLCSTSA